MLDGYSANWQILRNWADLAFREDIHIEENQHEAGSRSCARREFAQLSTEAGAVLGCLSRAHAVRDLIATKPSVS